MTQLLSLLVVDNVLNNNAIINNKALSHIAMQAVMQQNYLAKMDLDCTVFLCKNFIFIPRPGHSDTPWYHHNLDGPRRTYKDGIFTEKYRAVQVHFGEAVLL